MEDINTTIQRKEDTTYLSLLRIFAIYWVVFIQHNFAPYHPAWAWVGSGMYYDTFSTLGNYTKFVTQVTMPLCFAISGFILNINNSFVKKSRIEFLKNKTLRILLPCYLFGLVFELIFNKGILDWRFLLGFKHLWFLFYLYLFFIFAIFFLKNVGRIRFTFIAIFIVALNISSLFIKSGFFESITHYILFFFIGFTISKYSKIFKSIRKIQAILLIFFSVLLYDNMPRGGYELIVVPMIMVLSSKVGFNRLRDNKIFNNINSNSYGIYIYHMIILYCIYKTLIFYGYEDFLINNNYWVSSIISFVTIVGSFVVTFLVRLLKI